MKKALLLSVVASSMIMAGGDIAPVEPVVEAPIVEVYGWEFYGQAVAYMQTKDNWGIGSDDLFSGDSTAGEIGLQLGATNKDVLWGIGAGVELSVAEDGKSSGFSNSNFGLQSDAGITQAYLTYGIGNTSLKIGRQLLPKALSPFAFTEGWQMFKNSFDAALVVNTDITDTVLVYAFVNKANRSVGDISDFTHISAAGTVAKDGVHMVTAANKSIENLALTGTWYYAPGMNIAGDVNILWADAKYNFGENMYGLVLGLQGGIVSPEDNTIFGVLDDTTAFGAKIGGNFEYFDASIAFSSVDDGTVNIENLGTNIKTPLYTQLILNQNVIKRDSDTVVVKAGIKGLGGKFGIAYNYSDLGDTALTTVFGRPSVREGNLAVSTNGSGVYQELDLTYKTKITENTTLFAGYVYQTEDRDDVEIVRAGEGIVGYIKGFDQDQNFVRFWARYNF